MMPIVMLLDDCRAQGLLFCMLCMQWRWLLLLVTADAPTFIMRTLKLILVRGFLGSWVLGFVNKPIWSISCSGLQYFTSGGGVPGDGPGKTSADSCEDVVFEAVYSM